MPPLAHMGEEREMVTRSFQVEVAIEDLFLAIEKGDAAAVNEMLEMNFEKGWRGEVGGCGRTALQVACSFPKVDVMQVLVKHGWSVHEVDARDRTPLHYAALNGSTDIAAALIALGANINSLDKWGQTPLHLASHYGDTKMCLLLLEQGSDARRRDSTGQTPVEVASSPAVRDFLMESMKSLK